MEMRVVVRCQEHNTVLSIQSEKLGRLIGTARSDIQVLTVDVDQCPECVAEETSSGAE